MKTEEIIKILDQYYPDARCVLEHRNNYEMAVAVILSAQTTDASVNRVTPALFEKYPDIHALAEGDPDEIAACIRSLGLYRNKARSIHAMARAVVERFNGEIPDNMKDLTSLPGVGRKCANVILAECFHVPALAVDTHVNRTSKRLGLAKPDDSLEDVERKLKRKIPRDRWIKTHHQLIFFGRDLCTSRKPRCSECPFAVDCQYLKGRAK
jgi:endonuclease-3